MNMLSQDEEIVELINGFQLIQNKHLFKLGMDAILLSDFLKLPPNISARCCDLGCGSGAVMTLLCARYPQLSAVGVEVQKKSADLSKRNLILNNLTCRAEICECDLMTIGDVSRETLSAGSFRYVYSNPPYRKLGSGLTAPVTEVEIARAEVLCKIEDICRKAAYLLTWGGSFAVVYRPDRLCDLMCAMREAGLEPKTLRLVIPRIGGTASMVLCEGKRGARSGLNLLPPLYIYTDTGSYTPEVSAIYGRTNG